jgi:NADPH:quinone reductase-like Zn-dependent oxidoreductase
MMTNEAMTMAAAGELPVAGRRPVPEPGPGEAVVRVRASSMNFHDLVNLMGLIEGPWPRVPMSDGAGEVAAVGDGVSCVAVGDRVISTFHPGWLDGRPTPDRKRVVPGDTCDGWLQQYVCYPAESLVATPGHLSDVEAATLPCAGTTAWSALEVGCIAAGDVVVTLGTGGVSLYALQLAKARGATVILTSSSDEKLALGASLGADHGVNYRTTPDWEREVRQLTNKRGADLVLELGGPDTMEKSVKACRMDGTVAIIGVLSGFGPAQLPVSEAMMNNVHLVGVTVGSVAAHADMCQAVTLAAIRPQISHVLGWDEVPEAMRLMQANEHVGKIAITIP